MEKHKYKYNIYMEDDDYTTDSYDEYIDKINSLKKENIDYCVDNNININFIDAQFDKKKKINYLKISGLKNQWWTQKHNCIK